MSYHLHVNWDCAAWPQFPFLSLYSISFCSFLSIFLYFSSSSLFMLISCGEGVAPSLNKKTNIKSESDVQAVNFNPNISPEKAYRSTCPNRHHTRNLLIRFVSTSPHHKLASPGNISNYHFTRNWSFVPFKAAEKGKKDENKRITTISKEEWISEHRQAVSMNTQETTEKFSARLKYLKIMFGQFVWFGEVVTDESFS